MASNGKIGMIAGKGDLPALLIQAAQDQSRDLFVLAIEGNTDPDILANTPHQWIEMADIAQVLEIFRREKVTDIVMAGALSRPPLKAFKPSALTTKLLTRIGKAFFAGDDALLKTIIKVFEEEGFRILGADELLKDLVAPAGALTQAMPDAQAEQDIAFGFAQMKEFGKLDVGQALMVCNGELLGKESAAGTDELITRCGALAQGTYRGILVKARKPGQEARVDLPSIGVETIRNLHRHGFAGVAVEAGGSLIIRKDETLQLANKLGLFVLGFDTP